MAITITTTAGAAAANAYASTSDATTYLEGRLDTNQWDGLSATQQARALVDATALIDMLPIQDGRHTDNASNLRFPTMLCIDDAGAVLIPTEVKYACIEMALAYVARGIANQQNAGLAAQRIGGVRSMSEGRLSVTFMDSSSATATEAQQVLSLAPRARDLLQKQTQYNNYAGFLLGPGRRVLM
jgi:hypothetical protein